jgi:hypothetical protein
VEEKGCVEMCCEQPNLKAVDEPWWVNVRAGARVTTFQSERTAWEFLKKGIDNVPVDMQQTYAALRFRYEQANA